MKKHGFKTEAELCERFITWCKTEGWTCYAETGGWDILLVRDGIQVGVQAKLQLNGKVLAQSINSSWPNERGPHHRAILVPQQNDLATVAEALGIEVFSVDARYSNFGALCINADALKRGSYCQGCMHDWNPAKLVELPEYIPDVAAGSSAPIQLTKWKIGALNVLAWLEVKGWIERGEIKACGVDYRRWVDGSEWLIPQNPGAADGRYVRGPRCPKFDEQHPTVYAEILAKVRMRRPDGKLV